MEISLSDLPILDIFQKVLVFLLVAGILIILHEMGHFLLARLMKVGVERFSFGFGPRIFKISSRGGTEFRVSLIPLGGYVKLVGESPDEDLSPEKVDIAFHRQRIWKRFCIVFAGPFFNILFPFILLPLFLLPGTPKQLSILSQVIEDKPAWKAGLRSGDLVTKIDGEEVQFFDEIVERIEVRTDGKPVSLVVVRGGREERFEVIPDSIEGRNEYGESIRVGSIGVYGNPLSAHIGVDDPESPAAKGGLKTGDLITKINGESVERWYEVERELKKILKNGITDIDLEIMREKELHHIHIEMEDYSPPYNMKKDAPLSSSFGFYSADTFLADVMKGYPAQDAGFQKGDRIVEVDGIPIYSWYRMREIIQETPDREKSFLVVRNGKTLTLKVTPMIREEKDLLGEKVRTGLIGIVTMGNYTKEKEKRFFYGFSGSFLKGWDQSLKYMTTTIVLLYKLLTGQVSAKKSLGGPISIAYAASITIKESLIRFIEMLCMISMVLGIINLLPIPVLDGGHILFFAIEKVRRGRPISERTMEVAQQIGFFLLILLMAYAIFVDFDRFFF